MVVDMSSLLILSLLAVLVHGIYTAYRVILKRTTNKYGQRPQLYLNDKTFEVEPVDAAFDWSTEKPRPYRPFKKGPYHMTMGLKSLDPNQWLLLDDTYLDVTNERERIVKDNPGHTVLIHPAAHEALFETYDMMIEFMIKRFPQYFVSAAAKSEKGFNKVQDKDQKIYNVIRQERLPRTAAEFPAGTSDEDIIRCLVRNLQEDFLILVLDPETNEYHMRCGSTAFPSGFDPANKINLALKNIHGPVPMYKEKLEKSMDKFFARMKVGQWVERLNWTIQTHDELYVPGINHATKKQELKPLKREDLDFDSKVFLRCERQILTRLPKTKAMLFTVRTYMTPLAQVKNEGLREPADLVDAIDNIPEAMAQYKRVKEWGPAVKEYLME